MRVTDPEADEPVTIDDVVVRRETDKAILCCVPDLDGGEEVWIAKSLIRDESEVYSVKSGKEPGKLVIPRWLAREKGLDE